MTTKHGTAAEILAEIGGATFKGNVELTANTTAAELARLNNQVTGTITLFSSGQDLTGSTKDLIDALKGIKGFKGDLTANTVVTVADIKALKASTQGGLTLSGDALDSTFVNVKAADIISAFEDVAGAMTGLITIKETITLAQAEKLSALTTGVVTATIAPATATDLLDATFKATDVLSVTVKGTYTATNLIDLDTANGISKISLSNKAQALTVDAGDVAALVTALDNTGYKGNVTVTGATAIDIDDLQALNKLTTGKITLNAASLADTATYSENAANLVKAFDGITGLKGDVTISSAANTVTIAELKAINKATSGEITVTNDQTLSGSAKDLVEALKDVTLTAASTVVVTGAVTLAQIIELQKSVVDPADLKFDNTSAALTGTTAQILAALASAPAVPNYKGAIKVTDTINAADLKTINDATTGKITLSKVSEPLSGDYDTLTDALDGITGYKGAITLVDTTNDEPADINDVAKLTTGKLTATLEATTVITDATVTALKDVNTKDAITFNATSNAEADATALLALSKLIPTATFANIATITEDEAQIGTNGKNVIDALNKLNKGNTAVDLDGTVSVASVKAINDATTGQISVETVKTAGGAFDLSKLGVLTQVTGLTTIDAQDGKNTNITISLADILAANDTASTNEIVFNILGDGKDTVTITDLPAWVSNGDNQYVYTDGNGIGGTVTINLTNVDVVLPA